MLFVLIVGVNNDVDANVIAGFCADFRADVDLYIRIGVDDHVRGCNNVNNSDEVLRNVLDDGSVV